MWLDATDIRDFYASPLGCVTSQIIENYVRGLWPNVAGMNVLGIGFPGPYLNNFSNEAKRMIVAMPVSRGNLHWPDTELNKTCLTVEAELPLPDLSVDRVIIIHTLEFTETVRPMMREVWRVLSETGRVIIIVPNRRGIWTRLEHTPFGYGHPYSSSQLSRLLFDNMFTPITTRGLLHVPPSSSRLIHSAASPWETIGRRWFSAFGGIISTEAKKQIYSGALQGEKGERRAYATIPSQ